VKKSFVIAMMLMALTSGVAGAASESNTDQPKLIKTETLLTFLESAMKNACEQPDSPFACYSKDLKTCKAALKKTQTACIGKMRRTMPVEIDLNHSQPMRKQFTQCVIENFVAALGPENLQTNKCRK